MTCSPPVPADTRLTGLSSDRFGGFKKSDVGTRLGVLPAEVLANSRFPPSREVMGIVPPDARAWMVAKVLLLMRAGLSALPRPPGVRLRARAPPGANWDEAISPGLSPAAAAIAAKLALVGNWAPCSAADSPGDATIT